jgi:hypothetical protein
MQSPRKQIALEVLEAALINNDDFVVGACR